MQHTITGAGDNFAIDFLFDTKPRQISTWKTNFPADIELGLKRLQFDSNLHSKIVSILLLYYSCIHTKQLSLAIHSQKSRTCDIEDYYSVCRLIESDIKIQQAMSLHREAVCQN